MRAAFKYLKGRKKWVRCTDGACRGGWGEMQWLTTYYVTIRTAHHWCPVLADTNLL